MNNCWRKTCVLLLSLVCSASLVFAEGSCVSCHKEAASKSLRGRYVHEPLRKEKCDQCHVAGARVVPKYKKSDSRQTAEDKQKIRWIKTLGSRQQEQWLRLPAKLVSGDLFIKAAANRLRSPVIKVGVPPLSALPEIKDDQTAPMQQNIRVSDVRKGISASVTLRWQTDEFSESLVYYGLDELTSVKRDANLIRNHSMVLIGLDAGKEYQYQVVSRDIFGNEVRSQVMRFSTDRSILGASSATDSVAAFADEIDLQWELFSVAGDFLLSVRADREVALSLGMQKQTAVREVLKTNSAVGVGFSHPVLKSSFDTNVTVCRECHQALREEYSHPIKVRAKRGMSFPAELPVLPDGTMSCMTCHDNHASNNEDRLRMADKSKLCRSCHKNY